MFVYVYYFYQTIKTVDLKCAISKPGVYNLNRFKIIINDKDNEYDIYSNFWPEVKLTDDILLCAKQSTEIDSMINGANMIQV